MLDNLKMKNQQQKIKATDKGTVACLKFTH